MIRRPSYGVLLVMAPLVGVVVSRVAASFSGAETVVEPVFVADGGTEIEGAADQCVQETADFSPLHQTLLVQLPKTPKQFPAFWKPSRRQGLRRIVTTLFSVHLKEAVPVLDGQLPPPEALDHLYRCRGFGFVHPVDPRLTDAVVAAATHFKADRVEVISAYRSPKFNDSLAKKGRHVAAESKHTKGMAMDVRVVGTPAHEVGKWFFQHFEGGVGTYVANDFVHIDTGPKRRWWGQ